MMICLLGVLLAAFNFGSVNYAGSFATDVLAGDWTGESICTVHPSSCNDEHVIYHITEPDSAGKLQINADKIVDGKPEFMGTLDCSYDKQHSIIACSMSQGFWEFVVRGKTMNGTLKLRDGTLYRKISVKKRV